MSRLRDSTELDDVKRREYFKQQQQLRTMAKRNVSADDMIENLLSRKEIFQKKKETTPSATSSNVARPGSVVLPGWAMPGGEPPLYRAVWDKVRLAGTSLADTPRLSTLLMSSRLTTDTLGYIWSLANSTVAGSLTQQELYITLGLVALAQNGYTFTSAGVLSQLSEPPLPQLDLGLASGNVASCATPQVVLPSVPTVAQGLSLLPPPTVDKPPEPLLRLPDTRLSTLSASSLSLESDSLPPGGPPSADSLSLPSDLVFGEFQSVFTPPTVPPPARPPEPTPEERSFSSVDVLSLALSNSGPPPPPVLQLNDAFSSLSLSEERREDSLLDEEFDDFKSADFTGLNPPGSLTVLDLPRPEDIAVLKPQDLFHLEPNVGHIEDLFPKCPIKKNEKPESDSKSFVELVDLDSPKGKTEPEPEKVEKNENVIIPPTSAPTPLFPPDEPAIMTSQPDSEDKYSALRMLDEVDHNSKEGDDFGDFLTADIPHVKQLSLESSQENIQVRCMTACIKVLQSASSTLDSITEPEVLAEVTSDPRGNQFLQELVEVYRVGNRLQQKIPAGELHVEFNTVWSSLEPYLKDLLDTNMADEGGPLCGVCLNQVGPSHVKYGINNFHAPCANFYLHCVDPVLPIAPVMAAL